MQEIAALFCRSDSVYRYLPGVDVWDQVRDARLFTGSCPVVAHPPCRGWGKYASRAKVLPGELDMARFAVAVVRSNGGVLEHPVGSRLWPDMRLPPPGGLPDEWGGFCIQINQVDWGHRALKPTLLYCRVPLGAVPPFPPSRMPETEVERMWRGEREATPPALASWLVQLARAGSVT